MATPPLPPAPAATAAPAPAGRAGRLRAFFRGLWVTREGVGWLLAAGALWGLGMYKGINLVTLLATFMLVACGLNAFLCGRGLRALRLRRSYESPVFAGSPFPLTVEVENAGPVPLLGVRAEDRGPDHAAVHFLARLEPGEKVWLTQDVVLPLRGWYAGGGPRACGGYPFGLVERRLPAAGAGRVFVLPPLGRLDRGRPRAPLPPAPAARPPGRRRPR